MVDYAKYEVATGRVLGVWSSTNPRAFELATARLGEGEALFMGKVDPATQYLPGGFVAPKPDKAPAPTALDVKAWAGRLLSYSDWIAVKAMDTGEPADPAILAKRQAIRDASNALEAMSPIPTDFTDARYWP